MTHGQPTLTTIACSGPTSTVTGGPSGRPGSSLARELSSGPVLRHAAGILAPRPDQRNHAPTGTCEWERACRGTTATLLLRLAGGVSRHEGRCGWSPVTP